MSRMAGVSLVILAIIAGVVSSMAFGSWQSSQMRQEFEAIPAEPAGTPPGTGTTPAPAGPTINKVPTVIPPSHVGRTACVVCHETGMAGAQQFPADHAGRTDAQCTACHRRG